MVRLIASNALWADLLHKFLAPWLTADKIYHSFGLKSKTQAPPPPKCICYEQHNLEMNPCPMTAIVSFRFLALSLSYYHEKCMTREVM